MWFRPKTTRPAYTPPSSVPTSHRRITVPAAPQPPPWQPPTALDPNIARDWLLNDAMRLEQSAHEKRSTAHAELAVADQWDTVAGELRRLAAQYDQAAPEPPAEAPQEPVYDEPQPPADPLQFKATWAMQPAFIEQALAESPSLEQVHAQLWQPPAEDDATAAYQPVNGWTR